MLTPAACFFVLSGYSRDHKASGYMALRIHMFMLGYFYIHRNITSTGGWRMMKETNDQQQAVKIYKALGEPTRLKIALLLKEESDQCCSALIDKLQTVAISTFSHHLKQLSDSGLLTSRKEGTYIYYTLDKEVAAKYAPFLLE